MSIEENKAVVRRLFDDVFGAGDVAVVEEIFTPEVLGHDATRREPVRGVENVSQVALLFRTAFPDARFPVEDLIAEQDRVVARWRLEGTHRGAFMGIEPTGRRVDVTGTVIYRLVNNRIAEYWGNFDALGPMQQLGALPR